MRQVTSKFNLTQNLKASPVSESQKGNNETLNKVQNADTLTNDLTSFSSQNENKDTSHTTTDLKANNEVQPQKIN